MKLLSRDVRFCGRRSCTQKEEEKEDEEEEEAREAGLLLMC